ncbi:hypothetical protein AERO_04375 [Aeromicrobium fastidiosum]|uniref:hypothetical protein n=1 Tax=Aeromicrobium fastidiosum TaxID=52699 RepID=UPI0020232AE5|nr:hypothetical protein [Aeromicrobium fastidiosum]MCL8250610.1 hypothetical protein [Aeromicrobium fastidiosum]
MTLLAACTSGSDVPEEPAGAAKLVDVSDVRGDDSGTFTVPDGARQIELTATCEPVAVDVTQPRVSFVVDTGTMGDDVLTFESECASDGSVSSGTSLPDGTPDELTYRVTPSDPTRIAWSLTVTAQ